MATEVKQNLDALGFTVSIRPILHLPPIPQSTPLTDRGICSWHREILPASVAIPTCS